MGSSSAPRPYKNCVLASLPADELKRLAPHLSPVTLKTNHTLHDPGQTVDTVYFLEEGICSVVVTMESGNTVEVGIIGRDGFVGQPCWAQGVLRTGLLCKFRDTASV
jgi:CRP-like cAMP-binding protein